MADKETEFNSYITSALEPAPKLEGDVKEADTKEVDTKDLDVKIDDVPNSSGDKEEDGGDIVTKIKRDVLGETDPDAKDKDDDGTEIPDAFTNACLEQGWTEDEIKEFASDLDDAALLSLIPEISDKESEATRHGGLEKQDAAKQDKSELGKDQAKQEVKAKAADDTAKKEVTNEELAAIKKELAAIKESIGEADKVRSARDEEVMIQTVNQVFDEASKDFEVFGKTDELLKYPAGPKKGQVVPTSPTMVVRKEVWAKAAPFIQSGIPVKDAMDIALTWYKGANLEKDVQRNLIKDLKKHETKLSAKRSGKETVRVFENEEERQAEVVCEAARKAGVKNYGE